MPFSKWCSHQYTDLLRKVRITGYADIFLSRKRVNAYTFDEIVFVNPAFGITVL